MPCPALPEGFDFTDPDLLHARVPLPEFADLRSVEPVRWIPQSGNVAGFQDEGYWAVTRHADVRYVSTHPELFSSSVNTAIIRFNDHIDRASIEAQRLIMLNMDPPEHTRVRQIVQRGFTPRSIRALEERLRTRAYDIVELVRGSADPFDFVTQVACELPLQAIAELIGIPQDDRARVFDWSNKMIAYDDPEFAVTEEVGQQSAAEIIAYAMDMAGERKKCPARDIVSTLVAAEDEGNLNSDEFGFFVLMLAVAGNETTRNAITHGMHAFLTHPDQWELYCRERPSTMAEEVVRWATPVVSFQRTATQDTELGGKQIKKGERVGLFYASANHDPEVFENPGQFDIMRDPNPHLGFGGGGPHYCLGKSLAVLEIDLIFNAVADAMPGIRLVEDPRRLRSAWINGVKELKVSAS
ncbi:cytochrome P450 [Streptomyces niveiscabiei]|uniref:cytochrome P450 n=1 Tax=Streptomyces niveiscabiei TaxID=164115 RepID=UPI0029B66426|nr:cytochrome P450 [Streptomyces niveiscabiei]MDX3384428.1 cytochrome P450 [Streptomyces niveiscabiei]